MNEYSIVPNLYQLATTRYPMTFESATPAKEGLLLKGEEKEYFLLKRYTGENKELIACLEAENYLLKNDFRWTATTIPLIGGSGNLDKAGQSYYLKECRPQGKSLQSRWHYQIGSELLAKIHLAGEGFQPEIKNGWEWPDWIHLFEMARDSIYEMHTTVLQSSESNLTKYFNHTVKDALSDIEEAIVHLRSVGYHEQRKEGLHRGYISLSKFPSLRPGLEYDLIDLMLPDLPACGLGTFLGQLRDWNSSKVINDVIDLITMYEKIRPLSTDEIDLIKGFLKFPWKFWWMTEKFFLKEENKDYKKYKKELKHLIKGNFKEIRASLLEL